MSKHINRNWAYLTSQNISVGDLVYYKRPSYRNEKANLCVVTEVNLDPTPREKIMVDNNLGSYNKEFITDFCKQRDNGKYSYIKFHDASQGSTSVLLVHPYYKDDYHCSALCDALQTPESRTAELAATQLRQDTHDLLQINKKDYIKSFPNPLDKEGKNDRYRHNYIYDDYQKEFNSYMEAQRASSSIVVERALQQWVKQGCDMREIKKEITNAIPFSIDTNSRVNISTTVNDNNTIQIDVGYRLDADRFGIDYFTAAGLIDWDVDERDNKVKEYNDNAPDRMGDKIHRQTEFWGTTEWLEQEVIKDLYEIRSWWRHTYTLEA
jgi:hypothetical protein